MKKSFIKSICIVIFIGMAFLAFNDTVIAANTDVFDVCQKNGIVKSFQLIGYCLYIVKVVVPLLLIIMGMWNLGQAILSSDGDALKKSINILVKRAIAAVVIFFIPTIISTVINLVDGANDLKEFNCLSNCISSPADSTKCILPSGGLFK